MKVAKVIVPPGAETDVSVFTRIASRYGYKVEVEVNPEVKSVIVEIDGLRFPSTDDAARHLAWEHLKRVFGKNTS